MLRPRGDAGKPRGQPALERRMDTDREWRRLNRANWDERVAVHLGPGSDYNRNLSLLRAGRRRLDCITEAELGPIAGLRVLHLQCHFGADTLASAQRGAEVVGLDFSAPAIDAARALAAELGLSAKARFVQSDVYEAARALPEPGGFDRVLATWGTICWLPDIALWARAVAHFLKPGGRFYFAEAHPAALVLDDRAAGPDGRPGWFAPYLDRAPLLLTETCDYADPGAALRNAETYQWLHPLGDVVSALIAAGLRLDWLHEHDGVTWRMFEQLVEGTDGLWRWPDRPWLPLSYSLQATRA
jgi:SAM-dependent methyltransferase